ncbi:hypothetical protein MD484_g8653, partial [Candolleomyces efflorescens]
MTALTTTITEGERDRIYYWDTVTFLVGGCIFKLPRYQFVLGSAYFAEKLEPPMLSDEAEIEGAPITLEGVTAPQFRVFLKLLFPIHSTSLTLSFTKAEWLIILELSTLWQFHEFRKLAKEHLEPQLDDPIEKIILGRAVYVPKWLKDGYETLVARPECISEEESERIGHLTTVRLYILRHDRALDLVASRFYEEIRHLEQLEDAHRTTEERFRVSEEEAEGNLAQPVAETDAEREANPKEQEDGATGVREEVRVEQEPSNGDSSVVDNAAGKVELPPQVESHQPPHTTTPGALESDGHPEARPTIEDRLQTMLSKRALKIELQGQLNDLRARGEDSAAIEHAEEALVELSKDIQQLYEEYRKNFLYWEKAPEDIRLKKGPTPEAVDRVREGILLHLTSDCKAFKFQLTLPPGAGKVSVKLRATIKSFLKDVMKISPTSDLNYRRKLTIEVTEGEFERWALDLAQRNTQ